jgi:hypothetical protein
MIDEKVLSEKLKYLIAMNSKSTHFDIMNVYIEFDYVDQEHTKIANYDIDVKFDYQGAIEFDLYSFAEDIKTMSNQIQKIISEFVITQDGKIVSSSKSNCYTTDPMIFNIDYEVDTRHIFDLGYKFRYDND